MCMLELNATDVVRNERSHLDVRALEKGNTHDMALSLNTKINRNCEVGYLVLHLQTFGS